VGNFLARVEDRLLANDLGDAEVDVLVGIELGRIERLAFGRKVKEAYEQGVDPLVVLCGDLEDPSSRQVRKA
jgi:hypothetical protein